MTSPATLPYGPATCQLVAMTTDHASFVVRLRTDPVVGRFLNPGAVTEAGQADWIRRQVRERLQDCNLVIQRYGQPIGTAALLNVTAQGRGEYGRFALLPGGGRLLALPAHWLVLRYGFVVLGLSEIRWEVREDNEGVVAFHEAFGYASQEFGASMDGVPEEIGVWQYGLDARRFAVLTKRHEALLRALIGPEANW